MQIRRARNPKRPRLPRSVARKIEEVYAEADRKAVQMMTTRAPLDAAADFFVEVAPGLAQRIGARKGMTIGELRALVGL